MIQRNKITQEDYDWAFIQLNKRFQDKRKKKGDEAFVSEREILGKAAEEHHELIVAMHARDHVNFKEELLDTAIVALVGIASLKANGE